MPLATETYTLDEALAKVRAYISELDETLGTLDPESDRAQALREQRGQLRSYARGLVWVRDEDEWGGDAKITLAAPTAGEKAKLDREQPPDASGKEAVLWFIALGTEEAPYASDDLSETFAELCTTHDGFVQWAEGQLNSLATPGNFQTALQTDSDEDATSPASSPETETETTSTNAATSSTSSSSDSRTD
jgi:hypothetical protein